jgi:hypothetical protein
VHIVVASTQDAIRDRLAADPWATNGMLTPVSIERWTVLLDGLDVLARTSGSGRS